jgi:hypothetical protein
MNKDENKILGYLSREGLWKNLYFRKISITQKIFLLLPIIFLFSPIWGTYSLFYNNSWIIFISTGALMLFSIWLFFKQKSYYEKKIFEKYYKTTNCNKISDLHAERVSTLLGEKNTKENRIVWKEYFSENSNNQLSLFMILAVTFGINYGLRIIKPEQKEFLAGFYVTFSVFMMSMIAFGILSPLFLYIRFKKAKYKEALNLIIQLDEKSV